MVAPPSHSPWQSPVPYLFGGLAAMVGLIAFAVVILACSYWKLSSAEMTDVEAGESSSAAAMATAVVLEEKYLVIMAGQDKPTFLATPMSMCMCNTNSSFPTKINSAPLQMFNNQ